MAEVTISRDFTKRTDQTITATTAKATGFYLSYKNSHAVIELEFLDANDVIVDQEVWAIRGEEWETALGRANTESTAQEEIDATLQDIITFVENTPGAKQTLIDLGKLSVGKGLIANGIRPLVQQLGA